MNMFQYALIEYDGYSKWKSFCVSYYFFIAYQIDKNHS